MRLSFTRILLTILLVSGLSACRPEIEFVQESAGTGPVTMSFAGENYSVNFSSDAASATVEFETNRKWTAKFVNDRVKDWCSISTESGGRGKSKLVIKVDANPDYDQRYASVDIISEDLFTDLWRTIFIIQKQKDAVLVSGNRFEMGKDGGLLTLEAKANVEYSCEIAEGSRSWISSASTKALASTVHSFMVAVNESFEKREGEIVFKSAAGVETVKVYQDGDVPTLVLSSDEIPVPSGGGEFSVEARSNYDVTPQVEPGVEWVREIKTKSMSTSTFRFIADHNPGRVGRTCLITFSNKALGLSDTVYVVQDSQPIVASYETLKASGRGGRVSFEVLGPDPGDYRLGLSDRWMSIAGQDVHEGRGRFFVDVQATDPDAPARDGSIKVYYKDFEEPDSIAVHQYQWLPSFTFTSSSASVAAPAIEGDEVTGFVFWGDGSQDSYSQGLVHSYSEPGQHTVLFEVLGDKKIPISGLENGMTISFRRLRKN